MGNPPDVDFAPKYLSSKSSKLAAADAADEAEDVVAEESVDAGSAPVEPENGTSGAAAEGP